MAGREREREELCCARNRENERKRKKRESGFCDQIGRGKYGCDNRGCGKIERRGLPRAQRFVHCHIYNQMDSSFTTSSSRNNQSTPLCHCGLPYTIKTSWTQNNPGRRFYGCPRYRMQESNACNYFGWYDPQFTSQSISMVNGLLESNNKLREEAAVAAKRKRWKLTVFVIYGIVSGIMWLSCYNLCGKGT
ncbi:uncharacterized protein LOC109705975 [Ananas comosus]|uniref:Uncharacterized protein LOC109705975 n=1 Tax=Ananas comosus TaxID=4615 RepID=A0A6P5EG22_ANACO|nr:uncharacterized protein LOC109705975 [Ananas comosus]